MCVLLEILVRMFNFCLNKIHILIEVNDSITEHSVNVFILFISILM